MQVRSLGEFKHIDPNWLANPAGFQYEVISEQPRQTGKKVSLFMNTYHPKLEDRGIQGYQQLFTIENH